MIQFQCLKRIFDWLGEYYVFGTKYSSTMYGTIYFNPSTGDRREINDVFKYDYSFNLSLQIDIDANDIITADVAYKISLYQGSTVLETNWYVGMILDYEMSKESPTYTLTTVTDCAQSDLEFREYGNTYEYDYVEMKEGRVNEWRKFCYDVNKRMYKDASHPTFSAYLLEPDFQAQIGASKWYKNGNLSKISHPNTDKTKKFIGALFDKLGLNSSDIDGQSFINKESIQHDAINVIYQGLSESFNQDLVYKIVTNNGEKVRKVKHSMQVMDSTYTEVHFINLSKDTTLRTLFNGQENNYGIWFFDENEVALEQVEDLNTVQFFFTIPYGSSGEEKVFGNDYLDTRISALYEQLGRQYYDEREPNTFYAYLRIRDNLSSLHAVIEIGTSGELQEQIVQYFKGIFPSQVTSLGFPIYEGTSCLFRFNDDIQPYLDVSQTTQAELDAFEAKLESVGEPWTKDETGDNVRYYKIIDNICYEMEIVSTNISSGSLRIFYTVSASWPKNDIKTKSNKIFVLNEPVSANGYYTTSNSSPGVVTLKNFTAAEQEAFINQLSSVGEKTSIRNNAIFVLQTNHVYEFGLSVSNDEIVFTYKYQSTHDYEVAEIIIEKDGSEFTSINLDSDLKGYFLNQEFDEGIYKIKVNNLATGEFSYVSINGASDASYVNNISYNSQTLELEVLNKTNIDFRMAVDNLLSMNLEPLSE